MSRDMERTPPHTYKRNAGLDPMPRVLWRPKPVGAGIGAGAVAGPGPCLGAPVLGPGAWVWGSLEPGSGPWGLGLGAPGGAWVWELALGGQKLHFP